MQSHQEFARPPLSELGHRTPGVRSPGYALGSPGAGWRPGCAGSSAGSIVAACGLSGHAGGPAEQMAFDIESILEKTRKHVPSLFFEEESHLRSLVA